MENKLPMVLESGKFPKDIRVKLQRAAEEIGFPLTIEDVADRTEQKPITFARVAPIQHLSTLSLNSSPFEFREKLKQIDAINNGNHL
jgi:hypothetical protein